MLPLNVHTACLAAVCAHGFYTGTRLALAVLTLKHTQSAAAVGVVMMAYALLPALLSPRIGRAADRHGVRPLLHGCLWLLAACALALWQLPHHVAVLGTAAALVGLGFNAFAVSIQKLIGSLPADARRPDEPAAERRKRHFGTLATASSISSFSGPLLVGWGLDHLAAGAVFGCLALLPLAAWALGLRWPMARPPVAPAAPGAAPGAATPLGRPLLLTPELRPLAVAIVTLTVAGDALGFLTPLIGQQHGLSTTAVGGILSAFAVGAFVVRLASGLFIARLSEWTYLSVTLGVCALLLQLLPQLGLVPALTGISFVLGLWLGLAQPMTQSLLHQSVPEHRVGEALGSRLALVGAAQASSPLVLGLGVQGLGMVWSVVLVGMLLAASGVYVARARPRSR